MNLIYAALDEESQVVALFDDAQKACDFAENGSSDAWFVVAMKPNGSKRRYRAFWCATLDHNSGSVHVQRDTMYRAGSLTEPCRHGLRTFPGHAPIQSLASNVAWAATKSEAVRRVRLHEDEGRKRNAMDRAWQKVEDEAKAELRKTDPGFWDPYGMWMDRVPGLRERCKAAADEAYRTGIAP